MLQEVKCKIRNNKETRNQLYDYIKHIERCCNRPSSANNKQEIKTQGKDGIVTKGTTLRLGDVRERIKIYKQVS